MKFHALFLFAIIALFGGFTATAQVNNLTQSQINPAIGQITNSPVESAATGISGNGRFVVFESTANIATENPRNADGNREIFLFDYAQRRIFQITNTLSLRNDTTGSYANTANIKVLITNVRPVISNDGRWIAFGSNATTAFPGNGTSQPPIVSDTNPGNFNAETFNVTTGTPPNTVTTNPLTSDGNTEMWLYQVPAVTTVNLSTGEEIPFTDLSAGTFTRVTNTLPSRVPFPGSTTSLALIGDDNRDASISDDGNYISFTSNRDLITNGNAGNNANDEIFTYFRSGNQINQITTTPRGSVVDPIINITSNISGNGMRVAFQSNADKPITGIAENNTERNFEVFVVDLTSNGAVPPTGVRKQITVTAPTNPGDTVNVFDFGRRLSRDGRYIALDSFAALDATTVTNQTSYALYVYDVTLAAFRQIGPRSDADAGVFGGEVPHFGGFTDYNSTTGTPDTLVFETRKNINATGAIPSTASEGLNPAATRPPQIYAYPLNVAAANATFKRLTNFPALTTFVPSIQPLPSNSVRRMTFSLGLTEIGTGNTDLSSEAFYYLLPVETAQSTIRFNLFTGASRQIVSASPVPTPSPTATPTPSPTPTPTTTPSPTPTPQTPPAVQGVSPGMLVTLEYNPGINPSVTPRTAVGSLARSFSLPLELSGVSLSINGVAAGMKSVSQRQITFVVPRGLVSSVTGTNYPVVINSNGVSYESSITIVPARPDIFRLDNVIAPNGRAQIYNIVNRVFRTEPFNVTTLRFRGGRRVPTVLRLFLTGVEGVPATAGVTAIRIGSTSITPSSAAVLREPGIYSFDFTLPAELVGAGDAPVVVIITAGGVNFQSRLDDTAPRVRIL